MKISKYLLFSGLLFITLLLLYFSFWNVPSMDDYILFYLHQHLGFWGTQKWIYDHNTGRYLSSFLGALFSENNFLYQHYYLHSIILIISTLLAYFALLKTINRHFVLNTSNLSLTIYSLLFFLLSLTVCPEVSSKYYWFSAAITYQTANILIILIITSLLQACFSKNANRKNAFIILSCFLIVLLNGTNEVSALLFIPLLICALVIIKKLRLLRSDQIGAIIICAVISMGFLLLSPGIFERKNTIPTHGIFTAMASSIFWLAAASWYIIKVPLFWLATIYLHIAGSRLAKKSFIKDELKKINRIPLIRFSLISALVLYLFFLPIAYGMNGSLPYRALNNIAFILLLIFCFAAFYSGYRFPRSYPLLITKYKYLLFILLILGNNFFFTLIQTTLSGYFYKQVMQQKFSILEAARKHNKKYARIDDYSSAIDSLLQKKYHDHIKIVVRRLIVEKPSLIYFPYENNNYITNSYLLNYYRLDSIDIGGQTIKEKILNTGIKF